MKKIMVLLVMMFGVFGCAKISWQPTLNHPKNYKSELLAAE